MDCKSIPQQNALYVSWMRAEGVVYGVVISYTVIMHYACVHMSCMSCVHNKKYIPHVCTHVYMQHTCKKKIHIHASQFQRRIR